MPGSPKDFLDFLPQIKDLGIAVGVLTSMITPALLISASGNFIISTSSRYGRVVDRMRELSEKHEDMVRRPEAYDLFDQRFELVDWQIRQQTRRLHHLHAALNQFYLCASLFVLTSISIALLSLYTVKLVLWLPVAMGLAGASFLMAGCWSMVLEVRVAGEMTRRETGFVHELVLKQVPTQDE
jgi:hypothetical protein